MTDGFLARWSQRKQALRSGQALVEPAPPAQTMGLPAAPVQAMQAPATPNTVDVNARVAETAQAPLPTLDDVKTLTQNDSFARFVAPEVAPDVRNAAMKKLFSDPHYKLMDGLDIYIGDYSQPSPLPASILKQMVSAQFLNLVDEPPAPLPGASAELREDANTVGDLFVAQLPQTCASADSAEIFECQSPDTAAKQPQAQAITDKHHDHTDLRLQPNHAATGPEPGRGTA